MRDRITGTNTTATAIGAMFLYTTTSSSCYMSLKAGIEDGSTDAEARVIPSLQAVIKKNLRIFLGIAGLPKRSLRRCRYNQWL